jgi:hypothetical protein
LADWPERAPSRPSRTGGKGHNIEIINHYREAPRCACLSADWRGELHKHPSVALTESLCSKRYGAIESSARVGLILIQKYYIGELHWVVLK